MAESQWTRFEPDCPSDWDECAFMEFVAWHEWVIARTMPHNSHEYSLRRNATEGTFDSAVRYIREHGLIEAYWNKPYKTLYAGEHKYWTMGAPVEETILINRKPAHSLEALRATIPPIPAKLLAIVAG